MLSEHQLRDHQCLGMLVTATQKVTFAEAYKMKAYAM